MVPVCVGGGRRHVVGRVEMVVIVVVVDNKLLDVLVNVVGGDGAGADAGCGVIIVAVVDTSLDVLRWW